MQRDFGRFLVALGLTLSIAMVMHHILGLINAEWTRISIDMVKHSMFDQKPFQDQLFSLETQSWTVWILGLIGIGASCVASFKINFGEWMGRISMLLVLMMLVSACGTSSNVVIVTPPNYVIVVDLSNASNQGEAPSDFNNGQLLQVAQVPVSSHSCAINSNDSCPDKLVAEVEGSPQSRIYTRAIDSGTDKSNQALCFEAQGTNGCLDFSVNAIIQKNDAKCYANKMGVTAVKNTDGAVSRFHFMAMPLANALDTRVMQIAGAVFAQRVVEINPLQLASKKFDLFNNARAEIVKGVHDQTCITLLDIGINGGVTWDSPDVQAVIDQATITAAQSDLATQQAQVDMIKTNAIIAQTQALEKAFGRDAAIRLMEIMKWNGQGSPYPPLSTLDRGQQPPPLPEPTAASAP